VFVGILPVYGEEGVKITELDGDDEDRPDRRTDRSEDVDDG